MLKEVQEGNVLGSHFCWARWSLHFPLDFLRLFERSCLHLYMKESISDSDMMVAIGSTVWFSHSVISDYLQTRGMQQARLPCPSPKPRVYANSCPLNWWHHPTISSSVIPFSSCLRSFPASGSFQMSQLFASGGQSIGVSTSTSVLPMNTQDWSPLGWTGWISLQSKGLSRVFSNTIVQKHQFFNAQLSL